MTSSNTVDPPGTATRRAAMRLLDAVLRRGLPLEAAMTSATADLERGDDRAFAHAIAAEALRRLPDLDAAIDSATPRPLPDDAKARFALRVALVQALALGTPGHAAIATVLPLVDGGPRRLVHGVFSNVTKRMSALPDPPHLPAPVAKRWGQNWSKAEADAARASIAGAPPLDLSLAHPAETEEWVERLGGTSLLPGHVRLPTEARVSELPGFAEGRWWVQDIAASLPARLLGAGNGRTVIDGCAAPGGKTMQLAAAGWTTTALDISESRLARLQDNLARTRLAAETVAADVMQWAPAAPVDAVLLDAPCSATGIFRRHPDVLHRVTPRAIKQLAEQQRAMIGHAADWVKPGGTLVYAVCSLECEEGEAVAKAFLGERLDYALAPVEDDVVGDFASRASGFLRVRPGALAEQGGADGFFVARFVRVPSPSSLAPSDSGS